MKINYYEGNLKLGEKWLYLITMFNQIQAPKETVINLLGIWAKDKVADIEEKREHGKITDLQFKKAKEAIDMAILEALWFIDITMT